MPSRSDFSICMSFSMVPVSLIISALVRLRNLVAFRNFCSFRYSPVMFIDRPSRFSIVLKSRISLIASVKLCRSLNGKNVPMCFSISFGRSAIFVCWFSLGSDAGCLRFVALAYPFLCLTCSCSHACAARIASCLASKSITSHPSLFNAGSMGIIGFGYALLFSFLLKYCAKR